MFSFKLFFVASLFISGCISESEIEPLCKVNDNECADKVFAKAGEVVLTGSDILYIEAVDPIFFDLVEGDLTIVDYKLLNNTLKGLKECKFSKVKSDFSSSKLELELDCPSESIIDGSFDFKGRIYSGAIQGKGDYEFKLGAHKSSLEATFDKSLTADGKMKLKISSFVSKSKVKTPVEATFLNLETSDRSKFTTQNWKAIGEVLQEPLLFASFKKILNNVNLYLRKVEFELF